MWSIEKLRNKTAKFISEMKIPGSIWLSNCVRTKQAKQQMNEHISAVVNSIRIANERIQLLSTLSPHCARWLTEENLNNLYPDRPDFNGGSKLIALDAINFLVDGLDGKPGNVVLFFERYVSDEASFRAVMRAFFNVSIELVDDNPWLIDFVNKSIANHMTKYVPGRWDYDTLFYEILTFPECVDR